MTPHPAATDEPAATPEGLRSARRLLRRKDRQSAGQWLVEGPQAVRELLHHRPDLMVRLFHTPEAAERHPDLLASAAGSAQPVSAEQLATITDAQTPQGLVAVARATSDVLPDTARLVVICAQVRDPGNAGTVIRCADAFGADAVILTEGSVELGNPKTVRASVGSLFHLPVVTRMTLADAVAWCREHGLQVLAADGGSTRRLDQLAAAGTLAGPTAWLMGNEAWGLPTEDAALADAVVGIPIWGAAESLNLATAAAVCLYTTAAAQRG